MWIQTPQSTNIGGVGYLEELELLLILFKGSGDAYLYQNVPPSVWSALRLAASTGSYFANAVRDRFTFSRVPEAQSAATLRAFGAPLPVAAPKVRLPYLLPGLQLIDLSN